MKSWLTRGYENPKQWEWRRRSRWQNARGGKLPPVAAALASIPCREHVSGSSSTPDVPAWSTGSLTVCPGYNRGVLSLSEYQEGLKVKQPAFHSLPGSKDYKGCKCIYLPTTYAPQSPTLGFIPSRGNPEKGCSSFRRQLSLFNLAALCCTKKGAGVHHLYQ